MTPEEFVKAMQDRQDKALNKRAAQVNQVTFSAQRVQASKSSQNDSRLIITCNKPGFIVPKFVETIFRERTPAGTVMSMSPTEIAIAVQGNKTMYISLEIVLARVFSHGAASGVEQFSVSGQWDKFPSRSGNFSKEEVLERDFSTLE